MSPQTLTSLASARSVFLDDAELATLEQRVAGAAKCRSTDPEQYFPAGGDSEHLTDGRLEEIRAQAREACGGCPVIASCLQLALQIPHGQHGIWGGLPSPDRLAILRDRTNANLARRRAIALAADLEAAELATGRARGVA